MGTDGEDGGEWVEADKEEEEERPAVGDEDEVGEVVGGCNADEYPDPAPPLGSGSLVLSAAEVEAEADMLRSFGSLLSRSTRVPDPASLFPAF